MVDEVNIKITADASEAQKALRDTKFYINSLKEDTELLKDIQVDYKNALAESGGKKTEKTNKFLKQRLAIEAEIAENERIIEKSTGKRLKDVLKTEKSYKRMNKTFKGFMGLGKLFSAGTAVGIVKSAIDSAKQGREDLLASQMLGITGGDYTAMTSGFSALGINPKTVNDVALRISDAISGAKVGFQQDANTLSALARFGISDVFNKDAREILIELSRYASQHPDKETAFAYRQALGISQDLFNELAKGEESVRKLLDEAPEKLGSLSTSELEDQKRTAEAWAEATTSFSNAVKSFTTGTSGEYLRSIAEVVKGISDFIRGTPEERKAEQERKQKELELDMERAKILQVRSLPVQQQVNYFKRQPEDAEMDFYASAPLSDVKNYLNLKRQIFEWQNPNAVSGSKVAIEMLENQQRRTLAPYMKRYMTPVPKELLDSYYDRNQEQNIEILDLEDAKVPDKISSATGSFGGKTIYIKVNNENSISGVENGEQAAEILLSKTEDSVKDGIESVG